MEIRSRIFERYPNYKFKIPLKNTDKIVIGEGEVNMGDTLFERADTPLKKSLSVTKVLGCKNEECERYVVKVDGEYLEEGEVIARKTSSGKLSVVELVSPITGILDLTRIKMGYVDILGEESLSVVQSDFKGYIETVNPIDGLVVVTDAVCVDGVVSSKSDEKFFGKLEVLGDGKTILKESNLGDDYSGKIVWVGPYLYNKVAVGLFERGAIAVITYAMSYSEFRDIGLPIMILGGFGSVHCDTVFLNRFLSFKEKFVMLDSSENQLFILSNSDIKNNRWFVNNYTNQLVISRSVSTYGYIGKIMEFDQESGNAFVDFGNKGKSLMNIGLLDFIDL